MSQNTNQTKHVHGWLDQLAISMALVCAVHCLILPILIVALPLVQATFFANEDFHLWMLIAVFPTTVASIFLGCKKHRDKWVGIACAIGLGLLVCAFLLEQQSHVAGAAHSTECLHCIAEQPLNPLAWINTLGGVFLVIAHSRNFYLCRRSACQHNQGCH
tara:strand:+ start:226 stop:705 length:480 start_codon:yes stop_codon:yes gene_type:complete